MTMPHSEPVNRDDFLASHHALVQLLVDCWSAFPNQEVFVNPSKKRYRRSDEDLSTYCSLSEAFQDFSWDEKNFTASTESLLVSRQRLKKSILSDSSSELFVDLCEVLRWGGVLTTSIAGPLLDKYNNNSLLEYFNWILKNKPFDASNQNADLLASNLELLSDSGTTKIYSVIGDSCVIYDDRVAAALGKIITWYKKNEPLSQDLRFVVGTDKRNPSNQVQKFRPKSSCKSKLEHAKSNLKANWLIDAAVSRLLNVNPSFSQLVTQHAAALKTNDMQWLAMRTFESALFMAGHTVK